MHLVTQARFHLRGPGSYDVDAAGTGIKGTSDGFVMVHKGCAEGNGGIEIITQVSSIQNNASRQAGIMLRSSNADDAQHIAVVINGKKQVKFIKRTSDGATTTTIATAAASKRQGTWLRLVYNSTSGSVLAYHSSTGVSTSWNLVGFGSTITLPTNILAGLVASKGASGGTKSFTFDNSSLNGTPLRRGNTAVIVASALDVKAFPNPAADRLSVRVNAASAQADWLLVNQMGQVVLRNQVSLVDGKYEEALDISQLTAGLYFLRVRAGEEVTTVKVVKK